MPPTKKTPTSKSKSDGSKKSPSRNAETEPGINTDTLCDETWKCDVVFLYEGDKVGTSLIQVLQQIPVKQFVGNIKVINKNDILKDVSKTGGKGSKKGTPKSTQGKEQEVELTDEQKIVKCIKENSAIPGKPLASVIAKYLIKLKVEDIKERRKMMTALKGSPKRKAKPDTKGKKDTKEPTSDSEEENKFVERPPLFVVLLGFSEYDLPIELVKQNIPLCAVVKAIASEIESEPHVHLPSLSSQTFNMTWFNFWTKYNKFMSIPENSDCGNDLATMKFRVQQKLLSSEVNLKDKKNNAINQLTHLMNYVRYLLARHESYCNSVTVTHIDEKLIHEIPDLYNTLIQTVPLESVSIPVILFALVEQICHWLGEEIDIANSTNKDSFKNLNSQSKMSSNVKCTPVIIRHNDEHSLRTFHLEIPEVDFKKIVIRFLSKSFLLNPWQHTNLDQMQKCFFEFHLQRLWKLAFENIQLKVFYIYLHLYILCRMKSYYKWSLRNSKKDDNGIMIDDHTGLPYDFSCNKDFFQEWLTEIENMEQIKSSLVSISDNSYDDLLKIKNVNGLLGENKADGINRIERQSTYYSNKGNTPHLIRKPIDTIKRKRMKQLRIMKKFLCCSEISCLSENEESLMILGNIKSFANYKYIEEMTPLSLLQSLQEALVNYSQFHKIYYYPSNTVLLWFHNNEDFIFEEYKTGSIDTLYGFRDYYINIIEPDENSLLRDKVWDITNYKNVSDIKDDLDRADKPKHIYDIGKKMIQFSQHNQTFSSQDGSNVTVKTEDWYQSSQFLNICISKIDIEMFIHLDKLPFMKNSGNAGGYNPTTATPVETIKLFIRLPNETLLTAKVEEKSTGESGMELNSTEFIYSDLTITAPTGLIIQVIINKYDNNNLYVKQSYTAKGPSCSSIWDENCRCFDRSGSILIFRNDGTVDIIYGSTALSKVENMEKVAVIQPKKQETEVPKVDKKKTQKKKVKEPKIVAVPENELQEDNTQTLPYKVTEHSIQSWSGIVYSYNDSLFTKSMDNNVNLRTIFYPFFQLYMDRNDGIKCLYTDDGKLVSTYDDGTILTLYVFEESDMMTPDDDEDTEIFQELQSADDDYGIISNCSSIKLNGGEEFNEAIDESIVSYKLGSIAEHPNYAKVEFIPSNNSIQLVLADDLIINIHNNNEQNSDSYEFTVDVKRKADLQFTKEYICFTSHIIKQAKTANITTIVPAFLSETLVDHATVFCKTVDSYGRSFLVDIYGNVKLEEPTVEGIVKHRYSTRDIRTDFYFDSNILKRMTERLFVVNSDLSGYEVIDEYDLQILDKEDEERFNNADVLRNPTTNFVSSRTSQYCIYQSHSDCYVLESEFNDIIPESFHKADLSKAWMSSHSPWFFNSSNFTKFEPKHFSYSGVSKDKRIQAVLVKTIQQVFDSNNLIGLEIILRCLQKYSEENKQFYNKYKQQGYSGLDGDLKLNENNELIPSLRKESPLWNVLRTECNVCRQTFGSPVKLMSSTILDVKDSSRGPEKLIDKIDYRNSPI